MTLIDCHGRCMLTCPRTQFESSAGHDGHSNLRVQQCFTGDLQATATGMALKTSQKKKTSEDKTAYWFTNIVRLAEDSKRKALKNAGMFDLYSVLSASIVGTDAMALVADS